MKSWERCYTQPYSSLLNAYAPLESGYHGAQRFITTCTASTFVLSCMSGLADLRLYNSNAGACSVTETDETLLIMKIMLHTTPTMHLFMDPSSWKKRELVVWDVKLKLCLWFLVVKCQISSLSSNEMSHFIKLWPLDKLWVYMFQIHSRQHANLLGSEFIQATIYKYKLHWQKIYSSMSKMALLPASQCDEVTAGHGNEAAEVTPGLVPRSPCESRRNVGKFEVIVVRLHSYMRYDKTVSCVNKSPTNRQTCMQHFYDSTGLFVNSAIFLVIK